MCWKIPKQGVTICHTKPYACGNNLKWFFSPDGILAQCGYRIGSGSIKEVDLR